MPIDVAAEGGGEHQDGSCRLLRLPESAEGDELLEHSDDVARDAELHVLPADLHCLSRLAVSSQPCLNEAEGDRIAADVVLTPLLGHRLGQAHDPRLGRRVVGLARVPVDPRRGGDVENNPRLRLSCLADFLLGGRPHVLTRLLDEPEGNGAVNFEHGLPLLFGCLVDHTVPGVARVVDDDVDSGKPPDGRVHESLHDSWLRQVSVDAHRLRSQVSDLLANGLAHAPGKMELKGGKRVKSRLPSAPRAFDSRSGGRRYFCLPTCPGHSGRAWRRSWRREGPPRGRSLYPRL
mmetsp:Transcript_4065/g.12229  ORF Transcript_4065/g.12229 Transcript_4065/m.12229 type:complete len:291 (+) Transcript_4065:107-979(+)